MEMIEALEVKDGVEKGYLVIAFDGLLLYFILRCVKGKGKGKIL